MRHPRANESLLQRPRLRVGPVKHRDVLQRHAAPRRLPRRLPRREVRLLDLVLRGDDGDVLAPGSHRVELERRPVPRLAYDGLRRLDDGRRAPVIFGQEDRPGAGKVGVELGPDVRNLRAAPAVDGLVDVAHHEHPRRLRGESANELVLRERRVLKLVHQHVAPPLPVEQPRLLTCAQQRDGGGEQVVEIEGVGRTQVGLVLVVEARELIADIRIALERWSGVAEGARHAAAVHADAGVHGGLCGGDARLCEGRVRLLLVLHEDVHHDLADDGFRVSLVVDYEVVAAAVAVEEVDVLAQHARRDGVERARSDLPRVFLADRRDEPLAHLPRRLVSEGDAEDVRRRHA